MSISAVAEICLYITDLCHIDKYYKKRESRGTKPGIHAKISEEDHEKENKNTKRQVG